jgi:hypothetical protein
MRIFAVVLCLMLASCGGINLGDNPGRDVPKQSGPLVIPPAHLNNGASE